MTALTRRRMLALSAGAGALSAFPVSLARAAAPAHALSVFGAPRHGPDFTHFSYVNPEAPKGGEIRIQPSAWAYNQNVLTFNTFNTFVLRGDAPPFMERLCHANLMVRGLDEPDAVYGSVAESVIVDDTTCTFTLREGPTFSDGSPITADDVVWSYTTLKSRGHPQLRVFMDDLEGIEALNARTVVLHLSPSSSNRLPPLMASVPPILSKAYYEANDFDAARLDIPVTSGPYTIGDHQAGRYVTYQKRDDWWGDGIPALRGHFNFDRVRVDFFRERTASFEAFKTGVIEYREEFTSKTWATEYNFPAVEDGRIVRTTLPDGRPAGAQGFFFNTRRKKFTDPRTREALSYAFDFEWMNQNLFYGLYERGSSYFVNSQMMATGAPTADELALLEPFRDQLPDAVFGPAVLPPKSDGSGRDRALLRRAVDLLGEAGWQRDGNGWVDADGEPLTIEFLYAQPSWERVLTPFQSWLERIGVGVSLRQVEAAQFQSRMNTFDFDIVTRRYAMAATPGEAIRNMWTTAAANQPGSNNLAGIANPVIDALTDTLINAPTRDELLTASRALDRVLRAGHYWIPQWFKGSHTVAYWDRFGVPDKPRYDLPVATTWWAKEA
ncbi:MAG: extracellular solute-binding protein [Pseudomonadota bacterium]